MDNIGSELVLSRPGEGEVSKDCELVWNASGTKDVNLGDISECCNLDGKRKMCLYLLGWLGKESLEPLGRHIGSLLDSGVYVVMKLSGKSIKISYYGLLIG